MHAHKNMHIGVLYCMHAELNFGVHDIATACKYLYTINENGLDIYKGTWLAF